MSKLAKLRAEHADKMREIEDLDQQAESLKSKAPTKANISALAATRATQEFAAAAAARMQGEINEAVIKDGLAAITALDIDIAEQIEDRTRHRKEVREQLAAWFSPEYAWFVMCPKWYGRCPPNENENSAVVMTLPEQAMFKACEDTEHKRGEIARELMDAGVKAEDLPEGPQITKEIPSERPAPVTYNQREAGLHTARELTKQAAEIRAARQLDQAIAAEAAQ